MGLQSMFIRDWKQLSVYVGIFFQYATGQNRIGNMPKFSINECNEKLFRLPNAGNLFDS